MATKKKAKAKAPPRPRVSSWQTREVSVSSAIDDAFSEADELKDELQNWFDSMPENLQGGSKGQTLEESIGQLESISKPDPIPDSISSYNVTYSERVGRKSSRSTRRDACVARLEACAEAARDLSGSLSDLQYDDNSTLKLGELARTGMVGEETPHTESDRDTRTQELDAFADECESAKDELEAVEFPGMYG